MQAAQAEAYATQVQAKGEKKAVVAWVAKWGSLMPTSGHSAWIACAIDLALHSGKESQVPQCR